MSTFWPALESISTTFGLAFLCWQVFMSRRALQSAAYQGIVAHSLTLIENVIKDEEALRTFTELGMVNETPELRGARWHFMALATMRHFENLSVQRELGCIDAERWKGYQSLLRHYAKAPGFTKWWSTDENAKFFSERFQHEIASL